MLECNRSPDVKAPIIETQLLHLVGRRIEIVTRIKSIIAAVIESFSMKLLLPDLITILIVPADDSPYSAL